MIRWFREIGNLLPNIVTEKQESNQCSLGWKQVASLSTIVDVLVLLLSKIHLGIAKGNV